MKKLNLRLYRGILLPVVLLLRGITWRASSHVPF